MRFVAKHHTQRPVEQMGRGVVALDRAAPRADRRSPGTASPTRMNPSATMPRWTKTSGVGLTVSSMSIRPGFGANLSGVADLTARFAVERRAIEDDFDRLAGIGFLDHTLGSDQGDDRRFCRQLSRIRRIRFACRRLDIDLGAAVRACP